MGSGFAPAWRHTDGDRASPGRRMSVLIMAIALMLGGCGGGASPTPSATAPATPAPVTTPSVSSTAEASATPAASATGAALLPAEQLTPDPSLAGDLTIWGYGATLDIMKTWDAEFAQLYPNIKLDYVAMDYPDYQLAIAAGAAKPDIFVIEHANMAQYIKLNALADLTDQTAPYRDAISQSVWNYGAADGRYYGMAQDVGPFPLWYNKDIFAKAGVDPTSIVTWDDFYTAAKAIKEKTGARIMAIAKAKYLAWQAGQFGFLLTQRGLGFVDAQGNVILDKEPRVREVLEFLGKLWQEDLVADIETESDAYFKAIADGKIASELLGPWYAGELKSSVGDKAAGKWGVIPTPVFQQGEAHSTAAGGSQLTINAKSTNKDAAWAYTQFALGRPDIAVKNWTDAGLFPALKPAYADPAFMATDPYFVGAPLGEVLAEVAADMPDVPFPADYQQMVDILVPEIQKYAMGQETAEQALANAAQQIRDTTGRQ
jgi:lactose/L-arabinose transport system substrate-binding protein